MRVLSGVFVPRFDVRVAGARPRGKLGAQRVASNWATLSSDQDLGPEFKYRIGVIAGGFFTWPIGERFDVQPEVLFSQQGASFDDTGLDSAVIKLDYLVTPILARYKLKLDRPGTGDLRWAVARLQDDLEGDREVERPVDD